jgi:hypothetical protein
MLISRNSGEAHGGVSITIWPQNVVSDNSVFLILSGSSRNGWA